MKKGVGKYRFWGAGLVVLIVSAFFWWARFCGTQKSPEDQLENIRGIRVGVDLSPVDFTLSRDGKFTGLQYDLLTLLFPDTVVQWEPFISREEALKALSSDRIDIYATSFAWSNNQTLESVTTTVPLYVSGFALVHRSDSLGRSWTEVFDQMQHISISIPQGAYDIRVLLENLQDFSYPNIEIVEEDNETSESLCLAVARGKIAYTVCDRNTAQAISKRIDGLVVETGIAFDLYQVWVLGNNSSDLLQRVNQQIKHNKGSSEWNLILKKYGLAPH